MDAYGTYLYQDVADDARIYKANSFDGTESYQLFPSLSEFNWSYDGMCNGGNWHIKAGDTFIMRMVEVYLIATEDNQQLGDGEKGCQLLEGTS